VDDSVRFPIPGLGSSAGDSTPALFTRLLGLLAEGNASVVQDQAESILAGDDPTGEDGALCAALVAVGFGAWEQGRVRDARGLFRAAIRRADRDSLGALRVYPLLALAPMLTAVGLFDAAETTIGEASEEVARAGSTAWADAPAAFRSRLHLAAGRLDVAGAAAAEALAIGDRLGNEYFAPLSVSTLAAVALHHGDLQEATRRVHDCRTMTAPRAGLGAGCEVWVESRLAEAQGGPARALDVSCAIYDDLRHHKRLLVEDPSAPAWLVRIALAAGDRRRARLAVTSIEQLAADNDGVASVEAAAAHARGLLDRDPAALARAAENHSHPLARAAASEDLGCVLADEDLARACRAPLQAALAVYEQAGALRDAGRVRSRLGSNGSGRRARHPLDGWESLTRIERSVAGNASEGLTNRKIAARMYLSPHTVDFHLRHIFRKLHVKSRVELTRLLVARD
jgi:DNA-binding CsgD family transcriptional regulator